MRNRQSAIVEWRYSNQTWRDL